MIPLELPLARSSPPPPTSVDFSRFQSISCNRGEVRRTPHIQFGNNSGSGSGRTFTERRTFQPSYLHSIHTQVWRQHPKGATSLYTIPQPFRLTGSEKSQQQSVPSEPQSAPAMQPSQPPKVGPTPSATISGLCSSHQPPSLVCAWAACLHERLPARAAACASGCLHHHVAAPLTDRRSGSVFTLTRPSGQCPEGGGGRAAAQHTADMRAARAANEAQRAVMGTLSVRRGAGGDHPSIGFWRRTKSLQWLTLLTDARRLHLYCLVGDSSRCRGRIVGAGAQTIA